jgi:hypothetical protein
MNSRVPLVRTFLASLGNCRLHRLHCRLCRSHCWCTSRLVCSTFQTVHGEYTTGRYLTTRDETYSTASSHLENTLERSRTLQWDRSCHLDLQVSLLRDEGKVQNRPGLSKCRRIGSPNPPSKIGIRQMAGTMDLGSRPDEAGHTRRRYCTVHEMYQSTEQSA